MSAEQNVLLIRARNEFKELQNRCCEMRSLAVFNMSFEIQTKKDVLNVIQEGEFGTPKGYRMVSLKEFPLDFIYREFLTENTSCDETVKSFMNRKF